MQEPKKFFEELRAQHTDACSTFFEVREEFLATEVGSSLSSAARINTKHVIASIKHILDQLTFQIWENTAAKSIDEKTRSEKAKRLYYPYCLNDENFRTRLGDYVDRSRLKRDMLTEDEKHFEKRIVSIQPFRGDAFRSLYTVCSLSRLPHQKLIEQKKTRIFVISALSPRGGGVFDMRFRDRPGRFSVWTYSGPDGTSTGIGHPPVVDTGAGERMTVLDFDPETMDFNHVEGAKTSVSEEMECQVEDMKFDGIVMLAEALYAVDIAINESVGAPPLSHAVVWM